MKSELEKINIDNPKTKKSEEGQWKVVADWKSDSCGLLYSGFS